MENIVLDNSLRSPLLLQEISDSRQENAQPRRGATLVEAQRKSSSQGNAINNKQPDDAANPTKG
jgi:hypothetical protein